MTVPTGQEYDLTTDVYLLETLPMAREAFLHLCEVEVLHRDSSHFRIRVVERGDTHPPGAITKACLNYLLDASISLRLEARDSRP